MGIGILAVFNDVDAANEAEFNDWYVRQHVPERVAIPGFRNGQRFICPDGSGPRNFTYYETDSVAVLGSAPYRARLDDPTEWTRRAMPWFIDMSRSVCRLRRRVGVGLGGFAGVVLIDAPNDRGASMLASLGDVILPELARGEGIISTQLWEADAQATHVDSTEGRLRRTGDRVANRIVVISATDEAALDRIGARVTGAALGASDGVSVSTLYRYRLAFALDRAP